MSQTKAQLIDPVDGSIVNADINASAAIDGSKISPTFTSTVNVTNTLPEIFLTDTNTSNARGRLNANGGGLLLGADNDNAAADSVISFAVDGSEKARIDANGRMMLGTTSPGAVLSLDNTGQTTQTLIQTEDTGGSGVHTHIMLKNTTGTVGGINTNGDNLEFRVDDNTVFSNLSGTENARITSNGIFRVGCTAQPSTTVSGAQFDAGGLSLRVSVGGGTSSTVAGGVSVIGGGNSTNIAAAASYGATLNLINSNNTDGNSNAVLFVGSNSLSTSSVVGETTSHSSRTGELAFLTSSGAAPAERVRITSAGDFCVGTTSAVGKAEIATSASEIGLTVTNDTHDSTLQILATAANKNSNIFFGDNDDGNVGAIDYDHNNNSLAFKVSGTEKARFDNSGDFSIGSSTINLQSSNRTVLNVNGQSSTALCLNSNDTITGFLFADSGEFRIQAEAGAGNLVKIRNNNGTICHFDDDGIKFNGDTAAANGLDDYEEGTFSPAFKAENNSSSASTNVSEAKYSKIGNKVTVIFYITLAANASGTTGGNARISGLPFTSGNQHSAISVGYYQNFAASQLWFGGTVQPGSTQILLRHNVNANAAAGSTNMDYDNNLQVGSQIIITATYCTN